MKNTKTCPKCNSTDILRFDGSSGPYGVGNNIQAGVTVFSAVNVNSYVCASCGYVEEWVDTADLKRLKESKKAKRVF